MAPEPMPMVAAAISVGAPRLLLVEPTLPMEATRTVPLAMTVVPV